jgi:hypothetical protein
MSTLKYKANERYSFAWSDPRVPMIENTGFEDVSTDVLKNLWLVTFQSPAVLIEDVEGDMEKVVRELISRELVERRLTRTLDNDSIYSHYLLKEKNGNC